MTARVAFVIGMALLAGCVDDPSRPAAYDFRPRVQTPGGRLVTTTAAEHRAPPAGARYLIAKAAGPVTPATRAALAARGYREITLLPDDALLVERGDAGAVPGVVDWIPYLPADRVARELTSPALLARALGDADQIPVLVHVMPGRAGDRVRAHLARHHVAIAGAAVVGGFGRISALLPVDAAPAIARALAGEDEVFFVERVRPLRLLNDRSAGSVQSGLQGAEAEKTPIWAAGLRGEGQIVGVLDTGLDPDTCWFEGDALPVANTWAPGGGYPTDVDESHRKIVAVDFLYSCDQYPGAPKCDLPDAVAGWDNNGHGTHIAGSIAGDRDLDPFTHAAADGLAPAARLVMQDAGYLVDACGDLPGIGCPVVDLGPLFAQAYAQGVRVHSNSYGDNENAPIPGGSNYSARSQDVDRFMWEHRDFLIVYAAGNSGSSNRDFSVGSPSTNKNGLSVGSSRRGTSGSSDDDMSSFSSRGWTGDGRIKPDVLAPGCNRSSGTNRTVPGPSCATDAGCGTSYAAPVAAAAAALIRQYFVEGFFPGGARASADGFVPSAALLKAMLVNASLSMGGRDNAGQDITPIPSNEQGWGRVQLDRSLVLAGGARRLHVDDHRRGLAAGDDDPFITTFTAVAAGEPLKLTLAWTDFPGVPDSAPSAPSVDDGATWSAAQLVNDLDLIVTAPDGTVLRGNVFAGGVSSADGAPDRRNNVEQILIAAPVAGTYTVEVVPHAIVEGDQEFALVATGAWAAVDDCAPEVPTGLVATPAGAGSAALAWSASAGAGSYRVWQATGACAAEGFAAAGTAPTTGLTVGALLPDTTYQLRVSALSADGRCESRRSACVAFTPGVAGAPDAGPGPGEPDASSPSSEPDAATGDDAGGADGGGGPMGDDDGGAGCACRAGGRPGGGATPWRVVLLSLAAAALVHRGRARTATRRAGG